jgi:uncharacterized membrane protein YfcA
MELSTPTAIPLSSAGRLGRRRLWVWGAGVVLISTALLLWPAALSSGESAADVAGAGLTLWGVFLAAMLCELVDSSLGMGYGTALTPILLMLGLDPRQIVPAVLVSELVTGVTAGLLHHHDGNIDLVRDRRARRVFCLLSALSTVGAVVAVLISIRISRFWLTLAIGTIVLGVGVVILATVRRRLPYRPAHIVTLGVVAAFNKGLSGGGYGPLVTGGQVVAGISPRQAVAVTSMAEALTSLVGVVAYVLLQGPLSWSLVIPLTLGAVCSVPIATLLVRRLSESFLRLIVGLATVLLGSMTLMKLAAGAG